jgi:hypothetical protein
LVTFREANVGPLVIEYIVEAFRVSSASWSIPVLEE